jgi:peptide-methionine (R)-S-oxide reductase
MTKGILMMRLFVFGAAMAVGLVHLAGCESPPPERAKSSAAAQEQVSISDGGPQEKGSAGMMRNESEHGKGAGRVERLVKSDDEWREQLSAEQYYVTRQKGTERAFTGEFWNHHADGEYRCVCCGEKLFESGSKFDSGCGWPSFDAPADAKVIEEADDRSHGMVRTEVMCRTCGAHLGHLFDDGPTATGMRYCINSASLKFEGKK